MGITVFYYYYYYFYYHYYHYYYNVLQFVETANFTLPVTRKRERGVRLYFNNYISMEDGFDIIIYV